MIADVGLSECGFVNVCVCVCMSVCVCAFVCVYVCVCVYLRVSVYVYVLYCNMFARVSRHLSPTHRLAVNTARHTTHKRPGRRVSGPHGLPGMAFMGAGFTCKGREGFDFCGNLSLFLLPLFWENSRD